MMKSVFMIGLVLTGLLFACNEPEKAITEQADEPKQETENKVICLELVYPVTFMMPDGSTVSGNNRAEVSTAILGWHEANKESTEQAVMQYPVNAIFKGKKVTVNNEEEMQRYRRDCAASKPPCFTFIFPITYIMPDGSAITIKDMDDIENQAAVRTWYDKNPGLKGSPLLKYPVDVTIRDGSRVTLTSDADMQEVRQACDPEKE